MLCFDYFFVPPRDSFSVNDTQYLFTFSLMLGVALGPADTSGLARLAAPLRAVVAEKLLGQWLALRLLEAGVIVQPASQAWDVLKLTPPLTLTEAEAAQAVLEAAQR